MTVAPREQLPTAAGQTDAGRHRRCGPNGHRAQGNSRDHDRGHRRRGGPVDGVVLQLLRLQGGDGPRVGAALPRRGPRPRPCRRRAGADQPRARLPGGRRALAHLPPPAWPRCISVSQLAMVSDDFAQYWAEICELPISLVTAMVKQAQQQGFCADDDPHLVAVALVSMLNQFCYVQLSGDGAEDRRRRCLHHDVGQHLLPHHLLQGEIDDRRPRGDYMTRNSGGTSTPGVTREFIGDGLAHRAARRLGRAPVPGHLLPRRGPQAEGGDDRHPLSDRLLRALPRGLHGHPRRRLPRLEHPVPRLREQLPARPRAGRHRRRCPLAARGRRAWKPLCCWAIPAAAR